MAERDSSSLPPPSAEQRKVAIGQFERAQQVSAKGDFDYAIQLLLTCCKLDPGNLNYRRYLRHIEKTKYKNNLRGSKMALLTNSASKARIMAAKRAREHLKVLEYGEEVLVRNPWDTGAQMDMAESADALGQLDLAVWFLEQARQKDPKDVAVNRSLARLYEKRGNFAEAIQLWDLVRQANPEDAEARHKSKDLAASETIARGRYDQPSAGADSEAQATARGEQEPESPEQGPARPGRHVAPGAPSAAAPGARTPHSAQQDRVSREAGQLRARLDADPTNASAYLHLASLYRRADQLDQARAVLEEGLGPTGNHFDLGMEIADLKIEVFRRNLSLAEEKLRKSPHDEELSKIRQQLAGEVNSRELDWYRQRAGRYPAEKPCQFEFGVRLLRAGQIDEAIRILQALRSEPRYQWQALWHLGRCFRKRKNWSLAQRNYQEALQNLPPGETVARKDILFQLARGFAEAGELEKAVELGNDLANLDFSYRDIGRLLDDWQSRASQ